ncbi:hypothetical protein MMC11_003095 [Xylographa trunciseda]|nr:hypothetical protein [Xylographa trunciseda]
MDPGTLAAIVALAVAFIALITSLAQVILQYIVTGQLIRVCDSVVYGRMPGQGRRVWDYPQFRFRVVYSIPQITLDSGLWAGLSSQCPTPAVYTTLPDLSLAGAGTSNELQKTKSFISGEASWVSFARMIQYSSGKSVRYELIEGDADRCPVDLPVVPMQLSMRDVVAGAIMAGMECTDVSFQQQTLSMQGAAGTITSSRHPVLGALLHFAPKRSYETHGFRTKKGSIDRLWIARMYDISVIAGYEYNLQTRKHFEEDEGSWVTLSIDRSLIRYQAHNFRQPLDEAQTLRRRRTHGAAVAVAEHNSIEVATNSQHDIAVNGSLADDCSEQSNRPLHRPQDGEWSFVSKCSSIDVNHAIQGSTFKLLDKTSRDHDLLKFKWYSSLRSSIRKRLSRINRPSVFASSLNILPTLEPSKTSRHSTTGTLDEFSEMKQVPGRGKARAKRRQSWYSRNRSEHAIYSQEVTGSDDRRKSIIADQHPVGDAFVRLPQSYGMHRESLNGAGVQPSRLSEDLYSDQETRLESARTEQSIRKWQRVVKARRAEREREFQQVDQQRGQSQKGDRSRSRLSHASRSKSRSSQQRARVATTSPHDIQSRPSRRRSLSPLSPTLRSDTDQLPHLDVPQNTSAASEDHEDSSANVVDGEAVRGRSSPQPAWLQARRFYRSPSPLEMRENHDDSDRSRTRGRRRNSSFSRPREDERSLNNFVEYGQGPLNAVDDSQLGDGSDLSFKTSKPLDVVSSRMGRVTVVSPSRWKNEGSRTRSPEHESPSSKAAKHVKAWRDSLGKPSKELRPSKEEKVRNSEWTRISRRLVSPSALKQCNEPFRFERFEEESGYIIVMRILTEEEIEAYVRLTDEIRGPNRARQPTTSSTLSGLSSKDLESDPEFDKEAATEAKQESYLGHEDQDTISSGLMHNSSGARSVYSEDFSEDAESASSSHGSESSFHRIRSQPEEEESLAINVKNEPGHSNVSRRFDQNGSIPGPLEIHFRPSRRWSDDQNSVASNPTSLEKSRGAHHEPSLSVNTVYSQLTDGATSWVTNRRRNGVSHDRSGSPQELAGKRSQTRERRLSASSELTISDDDHVLFLKSEDVLRRTRQRITQCVDIDIAMKVFLYSLRDMDPISDAAVIRRRIQSLHKILTELVSIIKLDSKEKDLANFIVFELDVLIRSIEKSLIVLESEFSLFEVETANRKHRQSMWAKMKTGFKKRNSCSLLDHLRLNCLLGKELLASLKNGNLSSIEKNQLKEQICKMNKWPLSVQLAHRERSSSRTSRRSSRPSSHHRGLDSPIRFLGNTVATRDPDSGSSDLESQLVSDSDIASDLHRDMSKPKGQSSHDVGSGDVADDATLASSSELQDKNLPTGKVNWLWISQTDIIPGYFATPWKHLFPEAVCSGAVSVVMRRLDLVTDMSTRKHVERLPRYQDWIYAGKTTYPSYAINAKGGVVVSGKYELVAFDCLAQRIPPIELLNDDKHRARKSMVQDVSTLTKDLTELMSLDCWLSFCGRLPEISDGPSNLLRTMPAFIQRIMTDFAMEFAILDRTSKDGGFQIIQDIADSLKEALVEHGLSKPEQLFALVAMLRAAKTALCVIHGPDTAKLREVLLHDVQVYLA